jgi:hypothetical protein
LKARVRGKCAICGSRPATTDDHIPPKGIFLKPKPNDLITVPSCVECNNKASVGDERFKVFLSLHGSHLESNPETSAVVTQALETLEKNLKLKREIAASAQPAVTITPGGIVYGRAYAVPWDKYSHDSVIERTVRGLYFHHFGLCLGSRTKVDVVFLKGLNVRMAAVSEQMRRNSVGNGQFVYGYERLESRPLRSMWLLQFFRKHWVFVETAPRGEAFSADADKKR